MFRIAQMTSVFVLMCATAFAQRCIQTLIDSNEIKDCFQSNGTLSLTHKNLESLRGMENLPLSPFVTLINLSHNQITDLDGCSFTQFPKLTKLWLNNNQLQAADFSAIEGLDLLEFLDLAGNNIEEVAAQSFSRLSKLQLLVLNNNKITQLPGLEGLTDLRELHITNNKLRVLDLEQFSQLSMLYILNAGFNAIASVSPKKEGVLPCLEVLFLNDNQLTEVSAYAFAACPNLLMIYLQCNMIKELRQNCFDGLGKLRLLFLYNNELARLESSVFNDLRNLQVLYLNDNKISVLDGNWRDGLRNLCQIDLFNNPVSPEQDVPVQFTHKYEYIRKLLDQYDRPFTVLELGFVEDCLSLGIAADYENSACVVVEDKNAPALVEKCQREYRTNIIVLQKTITAQHLKELSECEHFDLVLVKGEIGLNACGKEALDYLFKLGDYVLLEPLNHFQTHKNVLLKPAWGSPNIRFYPIKSSFSEKTIFKPRHNKIIPWIKGINLWTFKHMNGVYPTKEIIRQEIKRLAVFSHSDFLPWNMIIQGNNLELIDWDDPNAPANMHNADACFAQYESSRRSFMPDCLSGC